MREVISGWEQKSGIQSTMSSRSGRRHSCLDLELCRAGLSFCSATYSVFEHENVTSLLPGPQLSHISNETVHSPYIVPDSSIFIIMNLKVREKETLLGSLHLVSKQTHREIQWATMSFHVQLTIEHQDSMAKIPAPLQSPKWWFHKLTRYSSCSLSSLTCNIHFWGTSKPNRL